VGGPVPIKVGLEAAFPLMRKAHPAAVLLTGTRAWLLRLPPELGTLALCASFPRIANELSALWDDPFAAHAYFAALLLDSRGSRRGFPESVLAELLALQACYESEHPPAADAWRDR